MVQHGPKESRNNSKVLVKKFEIYGNESSWFNWFKNTLYKNDKTVHKAVAVAAAALLSIVQG